MLQAFKRLFQGQDLTKGNTLRCIIMFAIPLLIGNVAQLLYNTVDSIVIGRYVGDAALAALGSASPILILFVVVFMSIGAGVCILVSQYFGAREYGLLEASIGNSITLIAGASVFLTAFGILLSAPALRLINTPAESYEMARIYLIICFVGMFGDGFYNIMSGVLRGMGDSVFPLLILLFCTLLNTVLDIWFVAGLRMGVAGAAWATTIAKTASAVILVLKVLRKRDIIHIRAKHLKLRKPIVRNICRLGIPSGMTQGMIFLAGIVVQGLMNRMGVLVAATFTSLMKVDSFAVIPCQTFGAAASTFTGQNTGAGLPDRVKKGARQSLLLALCFAAVMVVVLLLIGHRVFGLFTKTDEMIDMGMRFIRILAPAYLMIAVSEVFGGIMRGAGDAIAPMWISMVGNVFVRIPLTILAVHLTVSAAFPNGHPYSNFVVMDICMLIQTILTLIVFAKGKWKSKAVVSARSREE